MSEFIEKNKAAWAELRKLVEKARKSIQRMTPEEIERLDVLYRRTTIHYAQASTRTRDAALIRYLGELVAAAHSIIYFPPRRSAAMRFAEFLRIGFGRSISRTAKYQVISAGLLLSGALVAYFLALHDPMAAYALLPAGDVRQPGSTQEQLLEMLRHGRDDGSGTKFLFASFLFQHNFSVGLMSLATGILCAVPTVILLVYNGMILGAFTAIHHQHGIYAEYWAWILPHGITEIFAIILCGGIGLNLGHAVLGIGHATRSESLKLAGREALRLILGVFVMLVFAATIESFLRQSHLPTYARLLFAAGTAAFWAFYCWMGHQAARITPGPAPEAPHTG